MIHRCPCTLPERAYAVGSFHWRTNPDGRAERYERCPAAPSVELEFFIRAGVPERYRGYTRATWPGEWPAEAQAFLEKPEGNVYIFGPNGTGKTHLATALLGELLTRGNTGLWCSAKDFAALNPERDEQDRVYIDRLCSAQVLVMDDLFSEGNFRAEWPRNVADRRYRRAFVTLFTSMRPPRATAQERERGIVGALEIDSDLASRACSGLRIERKGVDQRFVKRTA